MPEKLVHPGEHLGEIRDIGARGRHKRFFKVVQTSNRGATDIVRPEVQNARIAVSHVENAPFRLLFSGGPLQGSKLGPKRR